MTFLQNLIIKCLIVGTSEGGLLVYAMKNMPALKNVIIK